MSEQDYFSEQYWASVIEQIPIEKTGMKRCKDWCESASKLPEISALFKVEQANLGVLIIDLYWHPIKMHCWLEAYKEGKRFIADGHAGQYDSNFLNGYFGFLDDASEKLREVYDKKI